MIKKLSISILLASLLSSPALAIPDHSSHNPIKIALSNTGVLNKTDKITPLSKSNEQTNTQVQSIEGGQKVIEFLNTYKQDILQSQSLCSLNGELSFNSEEFISCIQSEQVKENYPFSYSIHPLMHLEQSQVDINVLFSSFLDRIQKDLNYFKDNSTAKKFILTFYEHILTIAYDTQVSFLEKSPEIKKHINQTLNEIKQLTLQ